MEVQHEVDLPHKQPTCVPLVPGTQIKARELIEALIDQKIESFDTPYDSSTEALPRMAAYHPSFAKVEDQYEHLLAAAAEMLESSKYHDVNTQRFLSETLKHRKVKYPPSQTLGLIGDSGVGESSHPSDLRKSLRKQAKARSSTRSSMHRPRPDGRHFSLRNGCQS